jgi:LmbE family N-acetylglucosaminyl deacetylase
MEDSYEDIFKNKQRVLVVAAHPDDAEVFAGGLIARLRGDNKQVRIVVTTNGEKGSEDKDISPEKLAKTRIAEQVESAGELGVLSEEVFNLNYPDGELENSLELIENIALHIREFKPDLVITHNPDEVINTFSTSEQVWWVNHRDHRHTAIACMDAIYPYSRDTNFFPHQLKNGTKGHIVNEVLIADSYEHPGVIAFCIDNQLEQKRRALSACKSVIPADHVEEYIEETKAENGHYYEKLRWHKLY